MISLLRKYKSKFRYAFEGLFYTLKYDKSVQIQFFIAIFVILICTLLQLNALEWIIILFCIFIVIAVELLNSAIEEMVDFYSPEVHHKAKTIKDISAAAVLVVSVMSFIIGLIIIGGKIL